MSDNADYNRLVRDRNSAQSQVRDANHTKAVLQQKIDRLETAKRILGNCHTDFGRVKSNVSREIHDSYSWKGSTYDRFMTNGESLITYHQTYYENIDKARDAINLEIARLENEIYRQNGILGSLHSLINSLNHRIENFFN